MTIIETQESVYTLLRDLVADGLDEDACVAQVMARDNALTLVRPLIVRAVRAEVRARTVQAELRADRASMRPPSMPRPTTQTRPVAKGSTNGSARPTPTPAPAPERFAFWRELADKSFSVPGRPSVPWLDATVADHRVRAEAMEAHASTVNETAARHRRAIADITGAGATCLRDLLLVVDAA